jgi:hypothetical protein
VISCVSDHIVASACRAPTLCSVSYPSADHLRMSESKATSSTSASSPAFIPPSVVAPLDPFSAADSLHPLAAHRVEKRERDRLRKQQKAQQERENNLAALQARAAERGFSPLSRRTTRGEQAFVASAPLLTRPSRSTPTRQLPRPPRCAPSRKHIQRRVAERILSIRGRRGNWFRV